MSMTTSHADSSAAPTEKRASKYVLQDWEPNNPEKWDSKLAWRTLTITTYSLILGFCVWFLPSAIAPKLTLLGFNLSASQLYWLTALPGLAAGLLRLVYMFLPPLIGTRKMVGITSLLFLIPMLGWFYAVQDNTTPYAVLLTLAFMCGIGGAAFSGYMPSTGYFFPKRLSGTALGLQGGIGNLGMSVIQLVGPILMGFGLFGMTWLAPQTQVGEHAYHMVAIIGGGIAGLMTLVGLFGLLYRRIVKKSVRLATSRNDVFMYLLLTCAILLGAAATLTTQILGKPGGYNYRETIAVWFRSIFTLQPDVSLMTDVPLQFKLHIIAALILFAAWPFTRLVHVVSAPVAYPTRPYVVYRSRRAATSTSRPARGWTPVRGGAAGPKAQSFPEDDAPYQGA